ncbi:MAG: hypothetical protein AB7E48_00200 [Deferribacterales bacterium]
MRVSLLFVLVLAFLLSSCSKRGVYESMMQNERRQCDELRGADREDCLIRTEKSYSDYMRDMGK